MRRRSLPSSCVIAAAFLTACSGSLEKPREWQPTTGASPTEPAVPGSGNPADPPGPPAPGNPEKPVEGCAAPADATRGALCIGVKPEAIAFAADARLDGRGVLWVAAYAKPDADPSSLLAETYVGKGAEIDLRKPAPVVRLDALPPGNVFVRAVFFDAAVSPSQPLAIGSWIGGYDLTNGVGGPLAPVGIVAGAAKGATLDLLLLRRLAVAVRKKGSVFPIGDAQGPIRIFASGDPFLDTKSTRFFGQGELPCGDLSGAGVATVEAYVAGAGPFWIHAVLDDYGQGGIGPGGSILSIAGTTPTKILLPAENRIVYEGSAATLNASVELGTVVPLTSFVTDATSCSP